VVPRRPHDRLNVPAASHVERGSGAMVLKTVSDTQELDEGKNHRGQWGLHLGQEEALPMTAQPKTTRIVFQPSHIYLKISF